MLKMWLSKRTESKYLKKKVLELDSKNRLLNYILSLYNGSFNGFKNTYYVKLYFIYENFHENKWDILNLCHSD